VSVAFRRDGKDWVEVRFADKSSSTTGDFGIAKAGRVPAEFGVKFKSGDLFIFGAVGFDIQELTLTSREGAQVRAEPIAPNIAGTDVPVFFAHLPAATQLTSIEAKRTDGTVIALDPGPGGVEPSAVSIPPPAPPSSASTGR
jgi:N-acetylmuramoyl-L-alanine amidase